MATAAPGSGATLADAMAARLAAEPSRMERTLKWLKWFYLKKPLGAISMTIYVIIFLTAIGASTNLIVPQDPIQVNGVDRLKGFFYNSPKTHNTYVLGTDELGRDLFSRLIKGAEISVYFSLFVTTFSVLVGGTVGLISAYMGGIVDTLVQRVVDGLQTIPFLVLAVAIVSILGPGLYQGLAAVTATSVPRPARLIRGSVLSAKENVWAEAARTLGASDRRIMFRHILPNVLAPMIVLATFILATAVITEASLSFLGIGAQPPTPSWGAMLTGSGRQYFESHPRLAFIPGLAISSLVFSTNMFGDSLRDILDPRLRGR
ncbi:MAG: ABC transporter permease [Dehalococcoidia bacterium]|nr:ABC transporter permease [Dehalococcoidia bacterium]